MAKEALFAKLSTELWQNDKAVAFAMEHPSAFAVWTLAISYCASQLNDGELSRLKLKRFLGATDDDISALIDARMLDEREDGSLWLHDFVAEQGRSRADVEAATAKKAEAGRKGGSASGRTRETKHDADTREADAKQGAGTSEATAKQTASTNEAPAKQMRSKTNPDTDTDTDIIFPPNPPRPDFDDLTDRIAAVYPTNRFDGRTSQTRFQLEAQWPKITKAASAEGATGDVAAWLLAKVEAYVAVTEPRYVKTFGRWIGGELYARQWVPEAKSRAAPTGPARSRSEENLAANMAKVWEYMTPAERAEYQRNGDNHGTQQG